MSFSLWVNCVAFTLLSLGAGEVFNAYELIWWWDLALHLWAGVIITWVFYPKHGFLSVALCLSALVWWETFEYGMDQLLGLNMQKSGLDDTMEDLIVGKVGSFLAYFYLHFKELGYETANVRNDA